ncbi:MAG: hypothetical protein ACLFTB_05805 [Desulfovibrionales bacterium]
MNGQRSMVSDCRNTGCPLYSLRQGTPLDSVTRPPLRLIRRYCLQCLGGDRHEIRQCSDRTCLLWPYRFGVLPGTLKRWRRKHPAQRQLSLPGLLEK